jgi:hypothetical protein
MKLHGKRRQPAVTHTFEGLVVEINMGYLDIFFIQGMYVNTEPVILDRNGNRAGFNILHGMVAAVVAELELIGLTTQGKSEHLMAQTNAEYRHHA